MTKKKNIIIVGLLMAISFIFGTVLAPVPALSDYFGTCNNGRWVLHQAGFYGVKLDDHLKITEVKQVVDHSVHIRVEKR